VIHSADSNRSVALLKCSASYAAQLLDSFLSGLKNPLVTAYVQEYVPVPCAPEPRKGFWARARELVMPEKQEGTVTYSSEAEQLYNALSAGIGACKEKLGRCIAMLGAESVPQ
jgi:hypothetical protein